jgi:hypothetical protein
LAAAKLQQTFHPLRFQRWAISDLNPFLSWLAPAAAAVKAQRQALGADAPARRAERAMSEITSAAMEYYREVRDAMSEAAFFQVYGNLFSLYLADKQEAQLQERAQKVESRELPVVKEALAAIEEGGYPEAVARVAALLARHDEPMPLERLHLKQELMEDYRSLLPETSRHEQRRIRGEQDIVVRYEPDRALATLPRLVKDAEDRKRLVTLCERLLSDRRIQALEPTVEQKAMAKRIQAVLQAEPVAAKRLASVKPSRVN